MSEPEGEDWLARSLSRARQEVATWPQWMKDAFRVHGGERVSDTHAIGLIRHRLAGAADSLEAFERGRGRSSTRRLISALDSLRTLLEAYDSRTAELAEARTELARLRARLADRDR